MDKGYHKIYWGLIFLSFQINLGPIKVIPPFISWLIILLGVEILQKNYDTSPFKDSVRYIKILILVTAVGDLISMLQISPIYNSIIFSYLPILVMILELMFVSKVLEGSIKALRAEDKEEKALLLEYNQGYFIILYTIAILGLIFAITFRHKTLLTVGAIFALIISIFLMSIINGLKKDFSSEE